MTGNNQHPPMLWENVKWKESVYFVSPAFAASAPFLFESVCRGTMLGITSSAEQLMQYIVAKGS